MNATSTNDASADTGTSRRAVRELRSEDWFGKASAGLICGFGLAIAWTGLYAWFGLGGLDYGTAKTQLNMWLVSPLWVAVLSVCFLFRSGKSAWGWLLLANAISFGALFAGRALLT